MGRLKFLPPLLKVAWFWRTITTPELSLGSADTFMAMHYRYLCPFLLLSPSPQGGSGGTPINSLHVNCCFRVYFLRESDLRQWEKEQKERRHRKQEWQKERDGTSDAMGPSLELQLRPDVPAICFCAEALQGVAVTPQVTSKSSSPLISRRRAELWNKDNGKAR